MACSVPLPSAPSTVHLGLRNCSVAREGLGRPGVPTLPLCSCFMGQVAPKLSASQQPLRKMRHCGFLTPWGPRGAAEKAGVA